MSLATNMVKAGLAIIAGSAIGFFALWDNSNPAKSWTLDLSGAKAAAAAELDTFNAALFEGGNIGDVRRLTPSSYELHLRSDNDDALPAYWRQWWYTKFDSLPTDRPVHFVLKGQGFSSLYVPAYSYDNQRWQLFDERNVRKASDGHLSFGMRFTRPKVYLARYVPYTYTKLLNWLDSLPKRRHIQFSRLGTTQRGRKIPQLTITDASVRMSRKSRVLIHARTHPGEVASNFLLEGLVEYLLGPSEMAKALRRQLIFEIVPMLNIDGVVAGNNRVTPDGVNLEGKWHVDPRRPLLLDPARVPKEVRLLHGRYAALAQEPIPITVALNLHSSAGEPNDQVFFFPHFGPRELGYHPSEAMLYSKQLRFIKIWRRAQGKSWFNSPPRDGRRDFLAKQVPESWWWRNFQDRVMALSIESVYGRAGAGTRWVTPSDMRQLGRSLAKALGHYHGI